MVEVQSRVPQSRLRKAVLKIYLQLQGELNGPMNSTHYKLHVFNDNRIIASVDGTKAGPT